MRKHALNLFLIILLSLLLFGCSSGDDTWSGMAYTSDDGFLTLTVSDDGSYLRVANNTTDSMGNPISLPAEYSIPASYKGIPVKEVLIWNSDVVKISIPSSVESLEVENCPELMSMNIPGNLKEISIYNAPKLAGDLYLPDSLQVVGRLDYVGYSSIRFGENISEVGSYIFLLRYCENLEKVYIPFTNYDESSGWYGWSTYLPDSCEVLYDGEANEPSFIISEDRSCYIFTGFDSATTTLEEVVVPSTHNGLPVSIIGSNAFNGCETIKSVTIPSSIKEIHSSAFEGSGIETITIPSTVEMVGEYAFLNCTSLSDVELQEGFKNISIGMFKGCTSLETLDLPSSLETIEEGAFSNSGIREIVLSEDISSVGYDVFSDCNNLISLTVPVNSFGTRVSGWTGWSDGINTNTCKINYCNGVDDLSYVISKDRTYYYCVGLPSDSTKTTATIPATHNGLPVVVASDCMYSVDSIEEITIENGVEKIESGAFEYCDNLKVIRIPSSVVEVTGGIGDYSQKLTDVYVAWTEGNMPSGWSPYWDYDFNDYKVTIHYGENTPDPEPGTDPDEPEPEPGQPGEINEEIKPYADEILLKIMGNVQNAGTYREENGRASFTYSGPFGGVDIVSPDFGDELTVVSATVNLTFYGNVASEESAGSGEAVFTPDTFIISTDSPIQMMYMSGTTFETWYLTIDEISGNVSGVKVLQIDTGVEEQLGVETEADAAVLEATTIRGSIEKQSYM